jgi:lipase maturation factor 1
VKIALSLDLPEGEDHRIGVALVVRGLGVIGMIAFVSLAVQIKGLIGEHGILPAQELVEHYGDRFIGLHRIFGASDAALVGYCVVGFLSSLLVALAFAPGPLLVVNYLLYLTLCALGQVFLGYQWDALLCESFVVGALLASWRPRATLASSPAAASWAIVLAWVVVVRLTLGSGLSKLLSGDPTWRSFSALTYHYETQPLPTIFGWLAHQLPDWFQYASCAVMFAIQLLLPMFLFAGRQARHFTVAMLALLQLLIGLTGNYNFFNLLTVLLSLCAIDDEAFRRVLPARIMDRIQEMPPRPPGFVRIIVSTIAIALMCIGTLASIDRLLKDPLPDPLMEVIDLGRRVELANGYGLFASMTTRRDEIEIEATVDGETWKPYIFSAKPGPVDRAPVWVQPHQPRVDWQMWFAALGDIRRNRWLESFMIKLMEREPSVLGLVEAAPFDDAPLAIRAVRYRYKMAGFGGDDYWIRELPGTLLFTTESQRRR